MWFVVTEGVANVLVPAFVNHAGPPATGTASVIARAIVLLVTGNDPGPLPLP